MINWTWLTLLITRNVIRNICAFFPPPRLCIGRGESGSSLVTPNSGSPESLPCEHSNRPSHFYDQSQRTNEAGPQSIRDCLLLAWLCVYSGQAWHFGKWPNLEAKPNIPESMFPNGNGTGNTLVAHVLGQSLRSTAGHLAERNPTIYLLCPFSHSSHKHLLTVHSVLRQQQELRQT